MNDQRRSNVYTRFFDRLDRALTPAFGPPPVLHEKPVEELPLGDRSCPICGAVIFEHRFDEHDGNVLVNCPTNERLLEPAQNEPLNELGMPAGAERRARVSARV